MLHSFEEENHIKQLEIVVKLTKEFINLIQSNDYHIMCSCKHCKTVDDFVEKIEKELTR